MNDVECRGNEHRRHAVVAYCGGGHVTTFVKTEEKRAIVRHQGVVRGWSVFCCFFCNLSVTLKPWQATRDEHLEIAELDNLLVMKHARCGCEVRADNGVRHEHSDLHPSKQAAGKARRSA